MTARIIHIDQEDRVETGPVKFVYKNGREDWAGIFIRGDNAAYYSMILEYMIDTKDLDNEMMLGAVKSLLNDLKSSFEIG